MFGKQVTLFELFGFKIRVDASWVLLAIMVVWSLAAGLFPRRHPGLAESTYWLLGTVGAALFFASLILHEMSHSIVARSKGIPIKGITLFIFGGVAHMEDEPPSAKTELAMAIAGPIASVVLAGLFYGAFRVGGLGGVPGYVLDIPWYLAFVNALLAGFNLIPAFPLDGGRVFRALLWQWKGDIRWATRIAARVGSGFGIALIVLGALFVFGGNFITGIWWFLIGMFLRGAAQASYRQLIIRQMLEGEPVRRFMASDPVTVSEGVTIKRLVEDYSYRYHHDVFPVTQDSRLIGCIGTRQAREVSQDEWDAHTVGEMAEPCSEENTVDADTDAVKALSTMSRSGNSRLMVTENGRLVGIVALKDLLNFLSIKLDLQDMK